VASIMRSERGAQIPDEAAAYGQRGGPVPKKSAVSTDTVPCMHCGAQVSRMVIVCPRCDEPPVRRIIPGINDGGSVRSMQAATTRKLPWVGITTSLFYRNCKPTRLGRVVDRSWARVYALGLLPDFLVTLEVKGRRLNRTHATPLVVAQWNGARYLVSMLGESANWVKNVRAAHGEAIIQHGQPRRVHLVEIPPDERAPILKAFLQAAIGGASARPRGPEGTH